MFPRTFSVVLFLLSSVVGLGGVLGSARAEKLAATPPMGWNSWDAYGLTIDETDYRGNTTVLAGLKQFGWEYSVVDEGWYMQDPFAD
jgi:alpha-galactosidase